MRTAGRPVFCLFILIVLAILASCGGGGPEGPEELIGWHADIDWISDSLPLLHYDLFMYEPRDSLLSRLGRLEASLDSLTDIETSMELTRILASMRCSHTGIAFWDMCGMKAYPLSVIWLNDGLFVTAIDSRHSDLVGSRLLTYGESPAEEAADAMARLFPATNEVAPRTSAERFMLLAGCMEALGYGSTTEEVEFRFLRSGGDTAVLQLEAVDISRSGMTDLHSSGTVVPPLWLSSDDCYWHRYIPERRLLYCAYNSCSPMQGYPMDEYVEDLRAVIGSEEVEHLAVDLRRNSGGNSRMAAPLIRWLKEVSSSTDIQISLIIGRWTYSSGILNALEISEIPGVTVYGERTGGAPDHLGEIRSAALPYSGLAVTYPTRYFRSVEGPGTSMFPDVEIPLTPEHLFEGRNAVLDAITSSQFMEQG